MQDVPEGTAGGGMKHVTAREARELLNHAAHGPWEAYDPGDGTARLYTATDADGDLSLIHI